MRQPVTRLIVLTGIALIVPARAAGDVTPEQAQAEATQALSQAEALWTRSCPVPGSSGVCLETRRVADQQYCTGSHDQVTVRRDREQGEQALRLYRRVIELAGALPETPQTQALRGLAGRARLRLAEAQMERALAITYPTGLKLGARSARVRKRAEKQFQAWMDSTRATYRDADRAFGDIRDSTIGLIDPVIPVLATARSGQLIERFAHMMSHAWIPADLRTGERAQVNSES